MYVCTYVRMYACTHVRMYVRTYVRIYSGTRVCVYACMYACIMYVCMYACMYVWMYVCMCSYIHVLVVLYLGLRASRGQLLHIGYALSVVITYVDYCIIGCDTRGLILVTTVSHLSLPNLPIFAYACE